MDNTNCNTSYFQSEMSNLSPEHDDSDKSIRKKLVKDIAKIRVPHGEFNKQLQRVKNICPSITRNMINRAMHVHCTSLKGFTGENEFAVVSNEDNDTNVNFSRDRDGHPVGTTIVCKHENELRRVEVHNDNTMKYTIEKRLLPYGKRYF